MIVIRVMAVVSIEAAILIFVVGGGRLYGVGPLEALFPFYLHQDFRFRDKKRSVIIRSVCRVLWPRALSAGYVGLVGLGTTGLLPSLLIP